MSISGKVWLSKKNHLTPSQPSLWQFSSVSHELRAASEALQCGWRTCGTKSVTLRRQWTRIGMNRRCSGLWPLAGEKQNVCNKKAVRITSWKTVCLWLQVCACVCQRENRESFFFSFNACKNVRVKKRACSLVNMWAFFITELQSFNHSYWVTKDMFS